ncbi:hypothetical protein CYMTET_40054 [Cymbomonas tetramitiformis]|uniref:Mutator-like transposase domain-containing protein n=1 Tax=Cymbomonas tetramitiformis TaxID=36881 RepID=A0AAE0CB35_9CHLO|nr:hypothetical protein CYMTET_40054 [Cymbomonas tetramitiformis]
MPVGRKRKLDKEKMERLNRLREEAREEETMASPTLAVEEVPAVSVTAEPTPMLIDGRPVLASPMRPIAMELEVAASEIPPASTPIPVLPVSHETTSVAAVASRSPAIAVKVKSQLFQRLAHVRNRQHSTLQNAGLAPAKVEKFLTSLGIEFKLHRTAHGQLQRRVGKEVTEMAIECCKNALIEEALVTKEKGHIENGVVQLSATGDCAWPTRGSGRSYASFAGMQPNDDTGKQAPPPQHDCWRGARGVNCDSDPEWRGASKAMEAAGAVLCVKSIGAFEFCQPCDFTEARVAKFTADEDSNMIAAINDPVGDVPRKLQPVEKLSDPNHLQKLIYKDLEELRKAKGWKGSTLSKTGIDYFNKVYRYVIKSVAVIEDIPGFETDDEKAEWIRGALLNIVDHAFNIDPTHEACRRYRAPRPDGSFYPWCGVESCKPNWQIHLPHGKFLVRDEPAGYYEGIRGVFEKFANKQTILKQMHDTDTNTNESINGMVVRGYLPGGKVQQNAWAVRGLWLGLLPCHRVEEHGPSIPTEAL